MIAKWITCTIPDDKRVLFSTAQQAWSSVALLDGFVVQTGGWDRHNRRRACLLGIWRDRSSYQSFMTHHHDDIVDRSSQDVAYNQCDIRVFDTGFGKQGASDGFVAALKTARVLQVIRCQLRSNTASAFVDVQRDGWEREMRRTEVSGGLFTRRNNDPLEYFSVTAWKDLPGGNASDGTGSLRAAAKTDGNVAELDMALLSLEQRWLVVAR